MRLVLLCLTLATTQVLAADFEGIITGKTVNSDGPKQGADSLKMYLAPAGVRLEANGTAKETGGNGFSLTMIWRAAEPSTTYLLNVANKTYLKHDISKAREAAAAVEQPKVEKLGTTTFLGHSVQRVQVTFATAPGQTGPGTQELWIDTSLRFPPSSLALFGQEGGSKGNAWAALEKAGVVGIPLKDLSNGGKSGWEATNVEKKSLAASLFQVPPDYHEAKSALDMLPAAQQAAMKQQLQNMTPEQRAKFDEMMKKATQ